MNTIQVSTHYTHMATQVTTEVGSKGLILPALPRLHISARDLPDHLTAGSGSVVLEDGASVILRGVRGGTLSTGASPLLFVQLQDRSGTMRPVCVQESTLFPMNLSLDLERSAGTPVDLHRDDILRIAGPAFLAAGCGANAVYHWLHDYLPRIVALERSGITNCHIIVPGPISDPSNSFIRESLELLGVPKERLILAGHQPIQADELWMLEDLSTNWNAHEQLLSEVRLRLLSGACAVEGDENRIFVWRTGERRGLSNPVEVEVVLKETGVEKVSFEKLPLCNQILLAHNASLVAGPHGAGLFHTLFMREGNVLELFPVDPTGRERNAPCWDRILGVHSREGRDVQWTVLKSNIVPLSSEHFDLFQITSDCVALRHAIKQCLAVSSNLKGDSILK